MIVVNDAGQRAGVEEVLRPDRTAMIAIEADRSYIVTRSHGTSAPRRTKRLCWVNPISSSAAAKCSTGALFLVPAQDDLLQRNDGAQR